MLFSSFQKRQLQLSKPNPLLRASVLLQKFVGKYKENETNLIELFQVVLDRGAVLDGTYRISKLQPRVLCVVLW